MNTTMKSFAHSTGQSANSKSGEFKGALLGKAADGAEAMAALANLAMGHVNRFMQLAIQAAKVHTQKLAAAMTMPFASPDMDFNPTLNVEKAALAPRGLGLGGSARAKAKPKKQDDKDKS